MKVYTKTGDKGFSGIKNKRLPKNAYIFEAIGNIDELAGWLGILATKDKSLEPIQTVLFELGATLAGYKDFDGSKEVKRLEKDIDSITARVPELSNFIIPTGKQQSKWFIARAVCRRAERSVVALQNQNNVAVYLNRLSDLLFMKGYEANTNPKIWLG